MIVDEVGYRPLTQAEANLFFGFVSKRYENSSLIITSNKSVREWSSLFANDEVLAAAVLDRLLHHAYAISIDGRSYRRKDKEVMFKEETPCRVRESCCHLTSRMLVSLDTIRPFSPVNLSHRFRATSQYPGSISTA